MNVVNHVYPTSEQLGALLADTAPGPIVMLNLLKFRARAEYPDGRDGGSGRDAYLRYAHAMRRIVEGAGGRFIFSADVQRVVIGEVGELWDVVGIVEYPSRAAFHQIATSPEVQEIGVHREAGLAGQLLILTLAQDLASI